MMLLVKILGVIFIIASSTMGGFYFSSTLYKRKMFLNAFINFLSMLETNIRFKPEDIFTLINTCATSDYLSSFRNLDTQNFNTQWNNAVNNIPKTYGLTKEDKGLLYDFGLALGTTDVQGQIAHIDLYTINFKSQLEKSKESYTQKSKLYKILGFFLGTALSLIIL